MDCVAATVAESVVVTEVEATITVAVVLLDVDGNVLLDVHWIRDRVGVGDFDRHFDRIGHRSVDVHWHVFLDVHGIWHVLLHGHWVRHVFLDRDDDRFLHYDRHLFGDVHRRADVPVAMVGSQQAVVGQTVPFAVATVSVSQTPEASFALLLLYRLLRGGLIGFSADHGQAYACDKQHWDLRTVDLMILTDRETVMINDLSNRGREIPLE